MKQRKVLLVLGTTGYGKSFFVKKQIENVSRCVIFDPRCEYSGGLVFFSFQELAVYAYAHLSDSEYRYILRFNGEDWMREYENAARLVWIMEDTTLVLEESELFLSSFEKDPYNPINFLISQGRHHSISIIAISRRPSELSIKLRSVMDTVISFRQTEPRDLAYCTAYGFDAEKLPQLERGHYEIVGSPETISS